jgi:hypothetical protein
MASAIYKRRAVMTRSIRILLLSGMLGMLQVGCGPQPGEYAEQRQDPSQISSDDAGLQSKDVVACTNQLVADLLASPKLNTSPTRWTLVIDHVDDKTIDREFYTNYDIFLESLRSALSEKAQGRIQLIENKEKFNELRGKELEQGNSDPYQQGGGAGAGAPAAINPDYILYGKAYDMPNRSTNFYLLEFDIVNAHTRTQDWTRTYQVKVAR